MSQATSSPPPEPAGVKINDGLVCAESSELTNIQQLLPATSCYILLRSSCCRFIAVQLLGCWCLVDVSARGICDLTRGASLSAFEQLADNAEKLRLRQEMEDQQSDDGRNIGLKSGKSWKQHHSRNLIEIWCEEFLAPCLFVVPFSVDTENGAALVEHGRKDLFHRLVHQIVSCEMQWHHAFICFPAGAREWAPSSLWGGIAKSEHSHGQRHSLGPQRSRESKSNYHKLFFRSLPLVLVRMHTCLLADSHVLVRCIQRCSCPDYVHLATSTPMCECLGRTFH